MKTTPADVALEFIDMINRHDLSSFELHTTEDLLFIDTEGNRMHGRKPLQRCLKAYFTWFPDYSIEVEQSFASGCFAVITGIAMGTPLVSGKPDKQLRWRTPTAWQSIIRNNRIAEWRVFANNEAAWQAMHGKGAGRGWERSLSSDHYQLLPSSE